MFSGFDKIKLKNKDTENSPKLSDYGKFTTKIRLDQVTRKFLDILIKVTTPKLMALKRNSQVKKIFLNAEND